MAIRNGSKPLERLNFIPDTRGMILANDYMFYLEVLCERKAQTI